MADISGDDYTAGAEEVSEYFDDLYQGVLINILNGTFSMSDAEGKKFADGHTLDITADKTDGTFDVTTLNTAMQKALGDNKGKFALAIMHSAVATNLENKQLVAYLKYTDKDGVQKDLNLYTLNGRLTVTDGTWKEALALWKEDIDDGLIAINDDYNEWTKGIREKISTAFDETKQDFAQVKAEAKQGLAELKNDIKEELNGGIGHVEGFINKVVSGINSLISLLNAIKVDIPDNVPIIGGVSWGGLNLAPLNTVKIPRLANGGIATSSTIVNIAEQGKEAVLPLENNTGWMDDLANKLSQKIEVTVVPVPDPSGIFETVRVQAVEYNKSTGDRAFS